MRRRARANVDAPGQDSFLDVVANLVGILIILVMIIGARAKDVIQHRDANRPVRSPRTAEVEKARHDLAVETQTVRDLAGKVEQQTLEVAYRRNERDRLLVLIKTAQAQLRTQQDKLDADDQAAHQLRTQLIAAQSRLRDLEMTRDALQQSTAPVTVIKHRPTPLAKTVFGQEVHFRLAGGRITYVPLNELVDLFKEEARSVAWKLRQSPKITETVGPIDGFRLRYTLKKVTQSMSNGVATVTQPRVELDHFVLMPIREDLGEPLDQAMRPNSRFRSILASYDPSRVTVTIWVYPDSYSQFHQLKESLYQMGFLTAGRPMPKDQPITGSPHGTRSAAQ